MAEDQIKSQLEYKLAELRISNLRLMVENGLLKNHVKLLKARIRELEKV